MFLLRHSRLVCCALLREKGRRVRSRAGPSDDCCSSCTHVELRPKAFIFSVFCKCDKNKRNLFRNRLNLDSASMNYFDVQTPQFSVKSKLLKVKQHRTVVLWRIFLQKLKNEFSSIFLVKWKLPKAKHDTTVVFSRFFFHSKNSKFKAWFFWFYW